MENIKVVTNYLKSDLVKKQRSFRLGLITIFLVVLFISILMNFIIISPIIFLKLSENQIGEGDLIMTPLLMQKDVVKKKGMLQTLIEETETKNKTNDSLKNNSISIDDILKDINIEGVTIERVENKENKNTNSTNDNTIVFDDNVLSNSALNDLSFQLLNFTEIENKLIPQSKSKLQDKFNSEINKNNDNDKIFSNHEAVGLTPRWIFYGNSSTNSKWAVSSMIILNSRKENFYNYGRNKVLKNLDFLECYISESVQKSLKINLEDNSYINININPITLLKTLGNGNNVEYDKVNFTTSEVEDKENSFNPDIPNDLFIRQKRVEVTDFPTVKIPDKLNKTKILRIEEKDDGYGNIEDSSGINLKTLIESIGFLNQTFKVSINSDKILKYVLDLSPIKGIFTNEFELKLIKDFISSKSIEDDVENLLDEVFPKALDNTGNLVNKKNLNFSFGDFKLTINTTDLIDNSSQGKSQRENLKNGILALFDLINEGVTINSNIFNVTNNKEDDPEIIDLNSKIKLDKVQIINALNDTNVNLNVNLTEIINSIPQEKLEEIFSFKLKLKVIEIVPGGSQGKWPSSLGNVISFDSKYGKEYLIENIVRIISDLINESSGLALDVSEFSQIRANLTKDFLSDFNLDDYAMTVNVILNNKFDLYKTQQITIRKELAISTNNILNKLGLSFPTTITLAIYNTFQSISIVKLFLDNIFLSIMFFLIILSVMLIYSLMLGNVEERTYEFGMIRALGYKKANLKFMIIVQGLIFALPGIGLGLTVAGVLNIAISYFLYNFSGLSTNYALNGSTVLVAIIIGITIPLISSYFPIQSALSQNLKDSLTIFNKKVSDIKISILKLEKLGLSPASIIASVIMIVMGFGTYYLAPLAFFLQNFGLFLFLLNLLLIIMIIGMILMLQLLIPYLQRIFLEIIMLIMYNDKNIKFVVIKNLEGHFQRNQKTSIMFMISLSFVIFAGCTLELVANFIQSGAKNFFGSNIWVWQNDASDTINQIEITEFIKAFMKENPGVIKDFTFLPYPLQEVLGKRISFTSFGGATSFNTQLYGFEKNYLNSMFIEGYSYSELNSKYNFEDINNDSSYTKDIVSGLYINNNLKDMIEYNSKNNLNNPFTFSLESIDHKSDSYYLQNTIINPQIPILSSNELKYDKNLLLFCAEGLRKSYSFSTKDPVKLRVNRNPTRTYSGTIIAMAIKIPGYIQFSSYSTLSEDSPFVTSIDQFKEIIELESSFDPDLKLKLETQSARSKTYDNLRKKYLFVKLEDEADEGKKEQIVFELKNLINSANTQIVYVDDLINDAKTSSNLLGYIFMVIGIIALILSFFLIWISFYSNIRDNICEFGIMRAIGIDKRKSIRIYIYESLVLILSAILVGTFIGMVVSTTLVLQFNLFLELPFRLAFPTKLYIVMCVLGVFFSVLGSFYPTNQVNNLPLVKILKGLID